MRRLLHLLPLALLLALSHTASAEPQTVVEIVKVDGVIDRSMADYLVGSIEDAERDGSIVLLQLDTPGSVKIDAIGLAERVSSAKVPVISWVGPSGARAGGAGSLLLLASSLAATSPGSGIGAPEPLDLAAPRAPPAAGLQSRLRHWLSSRGRSADLAFAGGLLSPRQALQAGIVRLAASTTGELLEEADGTVVQVAGRDVRLDTAAGAGRSVLVRYHDLGPWRRILHAVASPAAVYVLLVLGAWGIAFELTQAGIGVAGISGALALVLAGYGLWVVPFSLPGLLLLVVGLVLLTADVLLHRLGPLTAGGLTSFTAGSVLLYGGVSDAIDVSPWLVAGAVAGCFLYFGFALTVALRSRQRIVSTRQGLVGLVGEARGPLAPEGPVLVKGALWRGRAMDGPIPPGTRIRVRGVDGLILRVEPEE